MQGNWLGSWDGDWLGDGVDKPPGSISGVATVSLSAVATGTVIAWATGAATISLSATGTPDTGVAVPVWAAGAATMSLAASGALTDTIAILTIVRGDHVSVGGTSWDAGSGYAWRAGKWIKAEKAAKVEVSTQYVPKPSTVVRVRAVPNALRARASRGHATTNAARVLRTAAMAITIQSGGAVAHSCNKSHATSMIVSSYNGACATLGMDEILALLDTR